MATHPHVIDVSQDSFDQDVIQESYQRAVLVDFWAEWCGPCKSLAPVLTRVVEELEGQVRLAKVDTEVHQSLAMDHGIRSLPTVRLYRDGKVAGEFMGAQPESAVREFIERFGGLGPKGPLEQARELLDSGDTKAARTLLERQLDEQADNLQARVLLAEVNLADGDIPAAKAIVDGLPDITRTDDAVVALSARITFAPAETHPSAAAGTDDLESRYQGALQAISSGKVEDGMETLLAIMTRDRSFRDDGARKALLDAFVMLPDDDPRVGEYRSRMFSLLH